MLAFSVAIDKGATVIARSGATKQSMLRLCGGIESFPPRALTPGSV